MKIGDRSKSLLTNSRPIEIQIMLGLQLGECVVTRPVLYDLRGKRIFVAGHKGLAGSAIVRRLADEQCEILTVDRQSLDLTRQSDTEDWLKKTAPDAVILAAGHVGGIYANDTYPADFIADN